MPAGAADVFFRRCFPAAIWRGFAIFPRFLLTPAPLRVILLTDSGFFDAAVRLPLFSQGKQLNEVDNNEF